MRALAAETPGSLEKLRITELSVPLPGPEEVRVRVLACGLNPVDHKLVTRGFSPEDGVHVHGLDVAGVIDAVGSDVAGWSVGDRVVYHGDLNRPGGLAEYTVADAEVLARLPEGVHPAAAAALPCPALTAWQAVCRLRLVGGETVLVHGAGGGVGGYAVRFAADAGAQVLATASPVDFDRARELGARQVLDYRDPQLADRAAAFTFGEGLRALIDTVSAENATRGLAMLGYAGQLVSIVGRPDLSTVPEFGAVPTVHEVALGSVYTHGTVADRRALGTDLTQILQVAASGRIIPLLTETVPLGRAAAALAEMAAGARRGKTVVTPD